VLFVGIDGEMSSTDLQAGGKLIQIGLSVEGPDGIETIDYLIRPVGEMQWSEEAAQVHKIPQEALKGALHPDEVDEILYEWLIERGANPKKRAKTIPVGFNIIGFDMPFVKATLPKTYSLFSRRMADLNGMLWLLHGKNNKSFETWKSMALDYAKMNMTDYKPHDAGWDSARHLVCFNYLRSVTHNVV
jgi:Exonuclease